MYIHTMFFSYNTHTDIWLQSSTFSVEKKSIHENLSRCVYIEHEDEDCGIQNIKLTMAELYEIYPYAH